MCVFVCVCCAGGQEAVFQGMEVHYKKFDVTKALGFGALLRSDLLRCCLRGMENL